MGIAHLFFESMEYGFSLLLIMITFFTSWQNEMLLDRLTGSLNDFIGFNNGSYFIEVPEEKIDPAFLTKSAIAQCLAGSEIETYYSR